MPTADLRDIHFAVIPSDGSEELLAAIEKARQDVRSAFFYPGELLRLKRTPLPFAITYCPARELWLVFRVSRRGDRSRNPVAYRRDLPSAVTYAHRDPRKT